MKYGNNPGWKRFLASPVALILVLIVLVILARATMRLSAKADAGEERLTQAQAEYNKLKERQADLSFKVGKLSTDEGLESEIRAKYRAVKEGESVAVILDDEETAVAIQASTTIKVRFWRKFLGKLGF
jgi:cell division protein FtsB